MHHANLCAMLLVVLTAIGICDVPAGDKKADPKAAIVLPKDPKAVVLSYDPGMAGFIRKGEPPYLKIQADGQVTVTSLVDGSKKETKLKSEQVQDLLRFVIKDNDFFGVSADKINDAIKIEAAKGVAIAVGGAGTSVFSVNVEDKKHEVTFRAARSYAQAYPSIKMLGQLSAIEKRLGDFAAEVGNRNAPKVSIALAQMNALTLASQAYAVKNNGNFPENLEVLVTGKPQYIERKEYLLDPWKQPYQYDAKGTKNDGLKPDIWTVMPTTNEVIGNWMIQRK